ncbi:MAG: hypothetical protein ACRC1T_04805 [Clostridium chrysemydis]|uniref:hypothetical protein n=1 Tax=Clostridium chrysemydis TaxID=2665504 RepID=UPI003F39A91B
MLSLRKLKNNLLKHFNSNTLEVYMYYDTEDNLEKVEVFTTVGYDFNSKVFKKHYKHEWERYVNMTKYRIGCLDGIWVYVFSGSDMENMKQISQEFYTK